MYLREVTLRNWRSYRSATFAFPEPRGKKRVVLVGAMNGTGKTSLLMALYLGLFGREAMPFIEGFRRGYQSEEKSRSFRKLMEWILHRPAQDDDDPHAFVELSFTTDDDEEVRVTRTWHFTMGGKLRDPETRDGEEVRIEVDGKVRAYPTWQDANDRLVNLLFPSHVAPCFFFDGEQAQARVEASGGLVLAEAVNVLFGTGILDQLSASLRSYIGNARANVKGDLNGLRIDELERKRQRKDALEEDIAKLRDELDECKRKHDDAEADRVAKLTELQQLVGDATIDIQHVATAKNDLERERESLSTQLRDALAGLALPMAFRRLAGKTVKTLNGEVIRDRWIVIRDETQAKADEIVQQALPTGSKNSIIPPLSRDQQKQLEARFTSALSILWSPPPKGCAEDYHFKFLSSSERSVVVEQIRAQTKAPAVDAGKLAMEWQATMLRLREAERKWDLIRDVRPRLEAMRDEIDKLNEEVKRLFTERSRLETAERGHQSELRDLKAAIGQMEKVKRDLDPVHDRLDVANRVREAIDLTRSQLLPLCRQALQERCTEHFQRMISDEYRDCTVEFDDDNQPFLSGAGPYRVYVSTLSGAQKRAFGLAFTLAVADVTEQQAPLVIDTPVGNMDSDYRLRILKYLAEHAPGQLILLSHNEEVYGPYAEAVRPWTSKRFLVNFQKLREGAGISTVSDDKYFGDGENR